MERFQFSVLKYTVERTEQYICGSCERFATLLSSVSRCVTEVLNLAHLCGYTGAAVALWCTDKLYHNTGAVK